MSSEIIQQTTELRSSGIGGSDAAVILGISPWKTPLQLAAEKMGPDHPLVIELGLNAEPFEGNRFTEAGKRLEDVVAQWYSDETGEKVARVNDTLRLKDHPEIMAHVDRRVLNKRKVLEIKTSSAFAKGWGPDGSDEIPDYYFLQVQHYLMFPNFDSADVVALIGGNDIRIYPDIQPEPELQAIILEKELAFWESLQTGDLPDPVSAADASFRYRVDNGQDIVADPYIQSLDEQLCALKREQKDLEAEIDRVAGEIKVFMGEASRLMTEDGKRLRSWKLQGTSGFDESRFREERPDLFKECSKLVLDRTALKKAYPNLYPAYQKQARVFR